MMGKVVMIGSAPGTRGGVAALVEVYAAHGLFQRWGAVYVPTHRDGSKLLKLRVAARAWIDVTGRLLRGQVAMLHVHLASDASFWRKTLFILPARALRVPYLLHMHGGNFIDFYERSRWPGRQALIRWIYRGARRVIALSEEWRDALCAMEPQCRVTVIPNPVEIPAWSATLDGDPPTVLFLGILEERKGVHDLLQAWRSVLERVPAARLVLAGSGGHEEALALAHRLGVAASVAMPGWVGPDERARLLRKAWVFALPSHVEALPMAVLEAMAAGVPAVATRVGGLPAAVDHGRTGVLVEPRDVAALGEALVALLQDEPPRRAMGRAARARALEVFSAEVVVPRIEALWRETLGVQGAGEAAAG